MRSGNAGVSPAVLGRKLALMHKRAGRPRSQGRLLLSSLILLSLLFAASFAAAHTIAFDPPAATVNHSVDAIVSGIWSSGCVPSAKNAVVFGPTITLTLD